MPRVTSSDSSPILPFDQEDTLADLVKHSATTGIALASLFSKGTKFSPLDVKRVYFGSVS